jgi:hypothetical protein
MELRSPPWNRRPRREPGKVTSKDQKELLPCQQTGDLGINRPQLPFRLLQQLAGLSGGRLCRRRAMIGGHCGLLLAWIRGFSASGQSAHPASPGQHESDPFPCLGRFRLSPISHEISQALSGLLDHFHAAARSR